LILRNSEEPHPLPSTSNFVNFSPRRYSGFFHTDHLIPAVFFSPDKDPKICPIYDDLSFDYIWDAIADPGDHRELMTGTPATWYDVRRNMDRLPDWVNPENTAQYSVKLRAQLASWLDGRLRDRLS
jgi:hypothetical protein